MFKIRKLLVFFRIVPKCMLPKDAESGETLITSATSIFYDVPLEAVDGVKQKALSRIKIRSAMVATDGQKARITQVKPFVVVVFFQIDFRIFIKQLLKRFRIYRI